MKRKRKIMILAACILSGLILGPPGAQATLITIQIEAVVDSVQDEGNYLEGKIKVGDIITGFYAYDSATPDTNPSLNAGDYEHFVSPCGIFLSVGGFDFATNPAHVDFLIEIENDHPPGDNYLLRSNSNLALPNGTPVATISWWLYDPTGNALSSDALPTTSPILNKWQINDLRLETLRVFSIDAHVTTAIPEPSTILLFGLCGLMLVRRNRK